MPQRTVRQARQALAEMAPALNPEMYRRYEAEVKAAAVRAGTMAHRYVDNHLNQFEQLRQELLVEACAVRDAYEVLAAEGVQGTITAREYNARLNALRTRGRELERRESMATKACEEVEVIEQDPEAWADDTFNSKYPHIRPDFTF